MAADLFAPLERVLAKYKRDVHELAPPATLDAVLALEAHLQLVLPAGLRAFLLRHNGAQLFRASLCIRDVTEIVSASAATPMVVLFADGPADCHWAFAPEPGEGFVLGRWNGAALHPCHATFEGWLAGSIAVVETRVTTQEDQDSLRFEADSRDLHQLVSAGERALRQGRPDEAVRFLREATDRSPTSVCAWQRLGEALTVSDRGAARLSWLQAFRGTLLPLPWPGKTCFDPDLLRQLAGHFADPEAWERELQRFLGDRVGDARSDREVELVVAVATELAHAKVRRGRRDEARDVLQDLLARARRFSFPRLPWEALLFLVRLETDLGHHDDAEALLRRLRVEEVTEGMGAGLVALARLAVSRQEPWAEEILDQAWALPLADAERAEAAALRVERAVRQERGAEAREWLENSRSLAARAGSRAVQALVALAEADVLRLEQRWTEAKELLRKALALFSERDDVELRYRMVLRLGDIALALGRVDEARRNYEEAVAGFGANQLPIREGWALVRLARVVSEPQPLLRAARDRFIEADLAAGVAAVDATVGDVARSLSWHLDRATAQARARHDAQRCRPPWDRADADRPERRLGAHRLAIAACGDAAVRALELELDDNARAISTGRGRSLDPPVMRYIAAVDLLAAHRSYSAARVLLTHLFQARVDGAARRALQGALARSPNAALVDGLLSCVENAQSNTADAVAAAAEVLGLRREIAAVRALARLAKPGSNPIARRSAVVALGRIGERGVAEELAPALDDTALAEHAALALLMLGDRRGIDFHGRALALDRRDLSGSPGEIVGRYGGPSYLLLLVRVAEGEDERAWGALQGLGLMGDPRAMPTLLKTFGHRERRTAEIAAGAIQILTGHSENPEEVGAKNRIASFWDQEKDRFREGVRHRDGEIFDARLLLKKMDDSDAWVRRTAYDELVITTGASLPFDADGPWRIQRAHLRAWHAWWGSARPTQPAGQWYLDGQRIS